MFVAIIMSRDGETIDEAWIGNRIYLTLTQLVIIIIIIIIIIITIIIQFSFICALTQQPKGQLQSEHERKKHSERKQGNL
jgi:hypothetical protein